MKSIRLTRINPSLYSIRCSASGILLGQAKHRKGIFQFKAKDLYLNDQNLLDILGTIRMLNEKEQET